MQFIQSTIEQFLKNLPLPPLNQDVVSTGWLQGLQVNDGTVTVRLKLGFQVGAWLRAQWQALLEQALYELPGIARVQLVIDCHIRAHAVQPGLTALPGVKNVIAIAAGKGGVGKSTTAANLALALLHQGARVGLLDADIYGPNQPLILGAKGRPQIREDKTILPLMAHGLQTMSIGYLVEEQTPMVWRGPMISAALQQLVRDTQWDDLDYLVIDLPPGTGDIQLTLAKKVPVTAAVMVTTPQDVALLDVRKGLEMFRKVEVNVLGVIENMSGHLCSHCGHAEPLFGEGGGERLAQACGIPLLGKLPLALAIREDADRGYPTVAAAPESEVAVQYRAIALQIAARLSLQKINYAAKFPKIVVETANGH
jgi:ATP-binding protein involved in chromosome partitioning